MKPRSIIDTEAEMEQVITELIPLLKCDDSAFARFQLRKLIIDSQTRSGDRARNLIAGGLERPWTELMPLATGGNGSSPKGAIDPSHQVVSR
jgi:hypothetical protein